MVTVFCVVVGVGAVIAVDMELSDTVTHVKDKIKQSRPRLINFSQDMLNLYLAKEGDTWLTESDGSFGALKEGRVPDRVKALMRQDKLLPFSQRLDDDAIFGKGFPVVSGCIHVLVKLPDEPASVRWYHCCVKCLGCPLGCALFALVVLVVVVCALVIYCNYILRDEDDCASALCDFLDVGNGLIALGAVAIVAFGAMTGLAVKYITSSNRRREYVLIV